MSGAHDLPEPPEGWTVSTNVETHIAYLYADGDGRSLAIIPTHPESTETWKVIGVAEYGPDCPRFAEAVSLDEAIDIATEEMEAVLEGESIAPANARDDRDDEDEQIEENDTETQSSLGEW